MTINNMACRFKQFAGQITPRDREEGFVSQQSVHSRTLTKVRSPVLSTLKNNILKEVARQTIKNLERPMLPGHQH